MDSHQACYMQVSNCKPAFTSMLAVFLEVDVIVTLILNFLMKK